jgi:hypothetical protein
MPIDIEEQTFTGCFGADFDANNLRAFSHVPGLRKKVRYGE